MMIFFSGFLRSLEKNNAFGRIRKQGRFAFVENFICFIKNIKV